jgi:L-ascorbate metabolism protein UlaG (beta-lactamase superfamily)
MHLTLIRNATLVIRAAGMRLLVDPQLDPAGARPAVPNTPNPRPNPLVELPEPPEALVGGLDAILVTHLHQDHFDDTARRLLPREVPVLCQPEDAERLRHDGFTDVRPLANGAALVGNLAISRTGGCHGTGEVGERMAPVSGFVLDAPDEPKLYIAGDTVFCDEVRHALARHQPDVVVVNGSAARFLDSDPIVMDAADVVALARHAPDARVVVVHLEAIAHATETRADVRARLHAEGLTGRVAVPEDGSEVPL